jgi:hypothetical protein
MEKRSRPIASCDLSEQWSATTTPASLAHTALTPSPLRSWKTTSWLVLAWMKGASGVKSCLSSGAYETYHAFEGSAHQRGPFSPLLVCALQRKG